jgi:hypothetical protein
MMNLFDEILAELERIRVEMTDAQAREIANIVFDQARAHLNTRLDTKLAELLLDSMCERNVTHLQTGAANVN